MNTSTPSTLVVCGHGMVAQRLLEKLVKQPRRPFTRIIVFNGEATPAYNRIQLSTLLAGDASEQSLQLQQQDWFRKHNIEVHQGEPVTAIDRHRKTVTTATGRCQPYQKLVIATGSRPASLGLPGETLQGVMGFRDLRDTRALINLSQRHRRAVVIGGGFLGLEAAEGLRSRGMSVTVLHRSPCLLNRQLDATGGALLERALTDRGLTIQTGTSPRALLGKNRVRAVQLDDETLISTDMVVVAAGIIPNAELARKADLTCERGICVNSQLQSSDHDIYALGECCQIEGKTYGLVEPGYQQAEVLAQVLCRRHSNACYEDSVIPTRLKISGIPIFSCGQTEMDDQTESVVWQDYENNRYCRLLVRDQRLTGAVLFGETGDGLWYSQRIQQADDISSYRAHLAFGRHFCEAAA